MVLRFCPSCGKEVMAPLAVSDFYACPDCGEAWFILEITEVVSREKIQRAPLFKLATDKELAAVGKEVHHAG